MFSISQAAIRLNPGESLAERVRQGEIDRYYFGARRNQPYDITLKMFRGDGDLYGDPDEDVSASNYRYKSTYSRAATEHFTVTNTSYAAKRLHRT